MQTDGPRVARFIERFLTLGKSYLGQPFRLMDWQKATLDDLYLLGPDGRRLRRTYVLGVPRKNGKSQLGAAIALYHLIADRADKAPEVISAAGDRAQARLVFDEARRMVLASPDLREVCTVLRNEIRCNINGGVYKAVSADAGLQQGLNPSCVIFDELHIFKNADLFEALQMGMGSRNEPLVLVISTAGYDLESPLGRLYAYGLRVDGHRLNGVARPGEVKDPAFGMTWYGPEPGMTPGTDYDPGDVEVWQRYNPSWPLINVDVLTNNFNTSTESSFIRYHLNGWTSAKESFLPAGLWDRLARPGTRLPDGAEVVLGFDGAWKGDSTALVAVGLEDLHVETLGVWEAPPNDPDWRTPAAEVEDAIRAACRRFVVREVAADPWRFEQSLLRLMEEGLPIVEFPTNSVARMVPATQAFYDVCRDEGLTHDGNPVLARHVANAVLREDARGARITKEHKSSRRHIDAAVAAVIGVHRALVWREEEQRDPVLLILDA